MRGRCAGDAWLFVDNAAAADDDVVIETEIHIKLLLALHSACCVSYVSGTRQPTDRCLALSKYVCMLLRMELNKLRVRRTIASSFVQFRRISYIALYIYYTG